MTHSSTYSPRLTESVWLTGQLLRLQRKSSGKIKAIHLRTPQQTLTIKASKYFRLEPGYCPVVQDWIQLKVLKTYKAKGTTLKAFEMIAASKAVIKAQGQRDAVDQHILAICHGSACRKRGAEALVKAMSSVARPMHIETSSCLGQCKVGPAVQVDGQIVAPMTPAAVTSWLQRMK